MSEQKLASLPVAGYQAQPQSRVDQVNHFKRVEERILRELDEMRLPAGIDQRWLAIGRTHLEQAFMAINRSILQPHRVSLPEDAIDSKE